MGQESAESNYHLNERLRQAISIGAVVLLLAGAIWGKQHGQTLRTSPNPTTETTQITTKNQYPWHKQIFATIFWVGESADQSNAYISNTPSAWIENWTAAYGGVDNPDKRCGWEPCDFKPHENAFYFALPFNDRVDGRSKPETTLRKIPWYTGGKSPQVSWVKNRWIEVDKGNNKAYAQWEDVGPLNENDESYVFGGAQPKFKKSGLDLSPATSDYLKLDGHEQIDWRFIDEADVPDGPWKTTTTKSPAQY